MKNQIWGYIRYLLLGIITATALLWSITVAPAPAFAGQAVANATNTTSSVGQEVTHLRHAEFISASPVEILKRVQDDGKTTRDRLVLSLPFLVDSHWTSVENNTPGIVWQSSPPLTPPLTGGEIDSSSPAKGRLGGDSIKFGIRDGQFIPGDAETDTWFIYGWFGAIEAIKQSYNVKYPEWNDRHDGIDFAGQEGIEVTSASTGTVIFAGKKIGNTVIISAGNGYQITYGHLQDINVKKGQKVKIGTLIGHLGKTGTTNPHLHFQVDYIKKGVRRAINPVPLLDAGWGRVIIPKVEANQFYTENQDPLTQPNFSW